jgi:hypothetical protein
MSYITKTIEVNGNEIEIYRVNNCVNGNPRYVIHWLTLGLDDYASSQLTRSLGLSLYRAKWFGGGLVFSSYSIERDVAEMIQRIKEGQ